MTDIRIADLLNNAADRVDQTDVPQTAEDTADFVDGVRWATNQVRQLAEETKAEDPGWRPDGLTEPDSREGRWQASQPPAGFRPRSAEDKRRQYEEAQAKECERRLARDLIGYVEQRLDTEAGLLQWRIAAAMRYLDQVHAPNQITLDHVRRYLTGGYDNER